MEALERCGAGSWGSEMVRGSARDIRGIRGIRGQVWRRCEIHPSPRSQGPKSPKWWLRMLVECLLKQLKPISATSRGSKAMQSLCIQSLLWVLWDAGDISRLRKDNGSATRGQAAPDGWKVQRVRPRKLRLAGDVIAFHCFRILFTLLDARNICNSNCQIQAPERPSQQYRSQQSHKWMEGMSKWNEMNIHDWNQQLNNCDVVWVGSSFGFCCGPQHFKQWSSSANQESLLLHSISIFRTQPLASSLKWARQLSIPFQHYFATPNQECTG